MLPMPWVYPQGNPLPYGNILRNRLAVVASARERAHRAGACEIAPPHTGEDGALEEVIQLVRVTKSFAGFVAVREANFGIGQGEFFAMLGPSGCGKTTTLRMIAGFESPTSGEIRLDGKDVSKVPPYKRNVNTVFQQYALFPHMSVYDNVAFGPRSNKVAKREVDRRVGEMLEIVRLSDFARRMPNQLSGGQQQRVALARALVNYPSALLLDEPLAALDLKLRQAMQLELKRIQREVGITFVFVTHDQEEALTMSDRIAVMNEGRVEQIGAPREIYDEPASVFVAGFIGDANLIQVEVLERSGDEATVSGCRAAPPRPCAARRHASRRRGNAHGAARAGPRSHGCARERQRRRRLHRERPRVPRPGRPLRTRGARRERNRRARRRRRTIAPAAPG